MLVTESRPLASTRAELPNKTVAVAKAVQYTWGRARLYVGCPTSRLMSESQPLCGGLR